MTSTDTDTVVPQSGWRRWLATLAAIEEAMSVTPGEIQDRRIAKLEARLAELQAKLMGPESGTPGRSGGQ